MRKDRATLLSYLSAAVLACVTLFVFWAFQNFGPDSTVRRLHAVVDRIDGYLPPDQPFEARLLQPVDAYELAEVMEEPISHPNVRWLIDRLIRPRLYARAKYSVYATRYESNSRASTVVLYELRQIKGAIVYVQNKRQGAPWKVSATETGRLLGELWRPVRAF